MLAFHSGIALRLSQAQHEGTMGSSAVLRTGKLKASVPESRPEKIRIFLIEDHAVMRDGLRKLLEEEPDLVVCGEAENARSAFAGLEARLPDLAIIDISLPGTNGLELIKNLKARYPQLRMLVLSMHAEGLYAERVLRAGAHGYVMKHAPARQLLEALRTVLKGEVYLSPALSSRLLLSITRQKEDGQSVLKQLSDRELEILRLIGEGYTTREISSSLGISAKTVESHRGNIRQKLHLKNGAELTRFALSHREEGT
jgi:DNA-binding NarL/FixJ family response regulator